MNSIEERKKPDSYYQHDRQDMLRYVPKGVRTVLDAGCGEGRFGHLVKERLGAEVWGVEVSGEAGRKAEKALDRVIIGDIENGGLALPEDYFDCVVFNDVLEHLRDPWTVLGNMRRLLKGGGHVVASVPNVRFYKNLKDLLFKKKWEYRDSGVLDRTHLRFFTSRSIEGMFESAGYEVVKIEGIPHKKPSWKLKVLNALLLNSIRDMEYMQFACVARKKGV